MKHIFSCIVALFLGVSVYGQGVVCLNEKFGGNLNKFTLVCNDQMPVKGSYYKNMIPKQTWFVEAADCSDGMAVFSASRRAYADLPTDNWLITPQLTLPADNVWLKWTSRAIHYHLRDGYKVMISTNTTYFEDFKELKVVESEEYQWTEHIVSLQEYAGQKVYIAFVHDSQNKFLLAIDDMFVGQLSEPDFIAKDETKRFVGNVGVAQVSGKVVNSGLRLDEATLTCVVNDTLTLTQTNSLATWGSGVEQDFHFDVPVQVGKVAHYKVMSGGNTIVSDSIICSYYPRTIFLEKATGTWCVNCPEVISFIQEVEERYGDQVVCVEAHALYGDPFEYISYVSTGIKTNSFPTILINRNRNNPIYGGTPAGNMKALKSLLGKPTIAKVELDVNYEGGDSIQTCAKVTFANDISGKYRVGFVLIEKELQTDATLQINGVERISQGEYYYMKSPVAADMMFYDNVVRYDDNAFVGIKNSLPTNIEGGVEYTVNSRMFIPSTVADKNDLAIIAVLMNFNTDEVLNVAEMRVSEDPTGVCPAVLTDGRDAVHVSLNQGTLYATSDSEMSFTIDVISIDGCQVASCSGTGSASLNLSQKVGKSLYLLRIRQGADVWTRKVVF